MIVGQKRKDEIVECKQSEYFIEISSECEIYWSLLIYLLFTTEWNDKVEVTQYMGGISKMA